MPVVELIALFETVLAVLVVAAVAVAAQHCKHGVRIDLLSLVRNVAEDFLDRAQLFGLAVNDEIPFVTEPLDVLAQDAHAEGVERANGGTRGLGAVVGFRASAKELVDALPHFARRLVRKRDRKNVSRADPFFHHARHAGGDDAGFSRAGARQNEDRPFGGFDRLSLGGIQ